MAWTIEYTPTAQRQLASMDRQVAKAISDYMDSRVAPLENPRLLGAALTGPLRKLWRYRVRDCRIICEIRDRVVTISVVKIGHRGEVYDR